MSTNELSRPTFARGTAPAKRILKAIFGHVAAPVNWLWRLATGRVCPICLRSVYLEQGTCTIRDQRTGRPRVAHRLCIPAAQRPAVIRPDVWRDRQMQRAAEQQTLDAPGK